MEHVLCGWSSGWSMCCVDGVMGGACAMWVEHVLRGWSSGWGMCCV